MTILALLILAVPMDINHLPKPDLSIAWQDMGNLPDPPPHEMYAVEYPSGTLTFAPQKPTEMIWAHDSDTIARIACCGCSIRFLPHGDAVIVPCRKHKRRMIDLAGHCDAPKPKKGP